MLDTYEEVKVFIFLIFFYNSRLFRKTTKYFLKFREKRANPLRKKAQYATVDFFAFVGGLLGLFAGFSALSL
jgi:Amiloride-sensitive sodium channel